MIGIDYHTDAAGHRLYKTFCEHGVGQHDLSEATVHETAESDLLDILERAHQGIVGCQCKRRREKQRMGMPQTEIEAVVAAEMEREAEAKAAQQAATYERGHPKKVHDLYRYLDDVTRRLPGLYDEADEAERAAMAAQQAGQAKRAEILDSPMFALVPAPEREQHLYDALLDERMAITRAQDIARSAAKRLTVTQEMAANLRAQAQLLAIPGVW